MCGAQYGMFNIPDEMLDNYVKEMLKKETSVENLVNRVIENKIAAAVKKAKVAANKYYPLPKKTTNIKEI